MTEECKSTTGPKHPEPSTNGINGGLASGCSTLPGSNISCPTPAAASCTNFQLSQSGDSCFIASMVSESLNIAGADMNVHKLLGVHEQCKTVDATGKGVSISNGSVNGFSSDNAFTILANSWRSIQTGNGVLASAYIGYDFGTVKVPDGSRDVYSTSASIRKHITAITIKQSPIQTNRVTRARVERSEDGIKWYGAGIVNLPDDDCLNTILFKESVLNRFWRIRPTDFNGSTNDYWEVQAIEMFHNYIATDESNVQDKVFLENRDREYDKESLLLKGSYDLLDTQSELSRFGIEVPSQSFYLNVSFSSCVALLGRPLIIGDIIEMPSEAQYSAEMIRILKWMEVTDVAWSTEGYTPGWQPTMLRVVLQPAYASQETQDIFGDLAEADIPDGLGLVENYGDGRTGAFQDYSDISQTIIAMAKEDVPVAGAEYTSQIRKFEDEEIEAFRAVAGDEAAAKMKQIGLNNKSLYTENAMPPNNLPYTEGTEYPTTANHGDYHRLTFEGLAGDVPTRLFRYSESKNRWIWLETDKRAEYDGAEPKLQEYITNPDRQTQTRILREDTNKQCEE